MPAFIKVGRREFYLVEEALDRGIVAPVDADDCRCVGCREYLNSDDSAELEENAVVCTCCGAEYQVYLLE